MAEHQSVVQLLPRLTCEFESIRVTLRHQCIQTAAIILPKIAAVSKSRKAKIN